MIVVDASVAVKWIAAEPGHEVAAAEARSAMFKTFDDAFREIASRAGYRPLFAMLPAEPEA